MEIAEDLRQLDLPVLILRGEEDPYLSGDISRRLHEEIPGSRLELLAGASHFLQEDVPDQIVSHLLDFLGAIDD
jgi:pimeloyl-ACP methyl ester carboxylesterase